MGDNEHGRAKLKLENAAMTNEGVYFSFYITSGSELFPGAEVSFEQPWSELPADLRLTVQEMLQAVEVHYSSLIAERFISGL